MEKDKSFILRFTSEQHERLRIESFERNTSMAEIIRQAVSMYLSVYSVREEK